MFPRLVVLLFCLPFSALSLYAQEIVQSRGIDQSVDYVALSQLGGAHWDDRNYLLTADDLAYLAPNENDQRDQIPIFFRVLLRKSGAVTRTTGAAQYPRSALQAFREVYGGFWVDGQLIPIGEPYEAFEKALTIDGEVRVELLAGANEVTVTINPVNPDQAIAGANGTFEQLMLSSTDGGSTWQAAGTLEGNTCCDPTVEWSVDGQVAYTAALGGCGFLCNIWFYRSTDGGASWARTIITNEGASDKEFLHVDHAANSPFRDNLYITWHDRNIMQFVRSTDRGLTFDPIISFSSEPAGIGSDITTDSNGNIYYFYPTTDGSRRLMLLKSLDGGSSFGPATLVTNVNAEFDYPIPAMNIRNNWIYAVAGADISGGTYDGSVYVAWGDTTSQDTDFDENANHSVIKVAYSRDGGATWTVVDPHPTDDSNSVDRFLPWMDVDRSGVIHLAYYDTQQALPERNAADFYYTYSADGAQTWATPVRISSETSPKLDNSIEWGDYTGLSVVQTRILGIWTDNRVGQTGPENYGYVAQMSSNTSDGIVLSAPNRPQDLCATASETSFNLLVDGAGNFAGPVVLTTSDLPAGVMVDFEPQTVQTGQSAQVTISFETGFSAGPLAFSVLATGAGVPVGTLSLEFDVFSGTPTQVSLTAPASTSAVNSDSGLTLQWEDLGASSYSVQVDSEPTFGNPTTESVAINSHSPVLEQGFYFWRVAAVTPCGMGAYSEPRAVQVIDPRVLVVDDPSLFSTSADDVAQSLDNLAVPYKRVSSDQFAGMNTSTYSLVIWTTGDAGFLNSGERALLETYMEAGGKLFLTSPEFLINTGEGLIPEFVTRYIGVASFSNDAGQYVNLFANQGTPFDSLGQFPVISDPRADLVSPSSQGTTILTDGFGGGAATMTDFAIFFAFKFASITDSLPEGLYQDLVMQAILQHFGLPVGCLQAPFSLSVAGDTSGCSGASLALTAEAGEEITSYNWLPANLFDNPESGTAAMSVAGQAHIALVARGVGGCSHVALVAVHELSSYDASFLPDWRSNIDDLSRDVNRDGVFNILDLAQLVTCQP